jgi:hypothetical protein
MTKQEKPVDTKSDLDELSESEKNELVAQRRRRAARALDLVDQVGGKALYLCF